MQLRLGVIANITEVINMMKRIMMVLFYLITCVVIAGCSSGASSQGDGEEGASGGSKEKITIRLSHSSSPTSTWEEGANKWAELAAEASNGRIEIQSYASGQLTGGSQETEMSMLQSGDIQATMTSPLWYTALIPSMTAFQMPFLIENEEVADQILDGEVGEEMLTMLEEQNIIGLAYGENGFRQITNNKHEVKTPEDLKGLKIRIPGIKLYTSIYSTLGADPTVMTWGEAFTGLQQGTIDGQENPIVGMIIPNRVYEVQKYITLWNYSYDPIILGVNKDFFESLAAEDQEILRTTAIEAMKYQREQNRSDVEGMDAVEYLESKGMVVTRLTEEAKQQFEALMEPLYEEFAPFIGEDVLNRFLEAAGRK